MSREVAVASHVELLKALFHTAEERVVILRMHPVTYTRLFDPKYDDEWGGGFTRVSKACCAGRLWGAHIKKTTAIPEGMVRVQTRANVRTVRIENG